MSDNATRALEALLDFSVEKELIEKEDRRFYRNRLLEALRMDAPETDAQDGFFERGNRDTMTGMLDALTEQTARRGLIDDTADARDRFAARLAGCVTPSPREVRERFEREYALNGPRAATDYLYAMSRACDYVRVDRVKKNIRYFENTSCGELEITINLSKPEKDPRDIASQRNAPQVGYPRCMLCAENPGYAGRAGYPARQNHRMVPLTLGGTKWYMQYSPYLYYDEHCIVLNASHVPMCISRATFERLFDFVGRFPHYFLGSNADLPIVGGSILSHDHFQGGCYRFPMDRAECRIPFAAPRAGVDACALDWPMTCVRLRSENRGDLIDLAMEALTAWRAYSDPERGVFARTDAPHNTVTPVLRKNGAVWTLYLVLRNNRTSPEHPLGVFHPHAKLHHIKRENIGLIEVMGLFILPGRLERELKELPAYLTGERPLSSEPTADSPLRKHYAWILDVAGREGVGLDPEAARGALRRALAERCAEVLRDAGVYKQNESGDAGVVRFMESIGYRAK